MTASEKAALASMIFGVGMVVIYYPQDEKIALFYLGLLWSLVNGIVFVATGNDE